MLTSGLTCIAEDAKKRRIAEEEQELDLDSLLTAPSDQNQPSKKDRKRQKKAGNASVPSANGYAVSKKRRRKTDDGASWSALRLLNTAKKLLVEKVFRKISRNLFGMRIKGLILQAVVVINQKSI